MSLCKLVDATCVANDSRDVSEIYCEVTHASKV